MLFRSAKTSWSESSVASVLCVWQEGKQASLAADFSVTQFKHLGRLLMVHGRNSYKRSAALSQFVIHRSLCISTMQVECRWGEAWCHLCNECISCAFQSQSLYCILFWLSFYCRTLTTKLYAFRFLYNTMKSL